MRLAVALLLATLFSCALPPPASAQERIEVFRLSDQSIVASPGATIYVVDAMRQHMARLSSGLPRNPADAQQVARARLQALTPQDQETLRAASIALVRAAEYRIAKVPAIVFDGRAVLYGITDIEQARAIYRGWKASKGG
jgi:integrating conjugative element protein (TIGR03757 family)